ncbi:hypothetical protein WK30_29525 [Burkholderia vietnamiensis]|nr:hypothetical protein A8H33_28610 [Burkholderia vietnamiensis]KVR95195.1 hypothetical protein WK30_29525 [Burkholderia vietnamiensis]
MIEAHAPLLAVSATTIACPEITSVLVQLLERSPDCMALSADVEDQRHVSTGICTVGLREAVRELVEPHADPSVPACTVFTPYGPRL